MGSEGLVAVLVWREDEEETGLGVRGGEREMVRVGLRRGGLREERHRSRRREKMVLCAILESECIMVRS